VKLLGGTSNLQYGLSVATKKQKNKKKYQTTTSVFLSLISPLKFFFFKKIKKKKTNKQTNKSGKYLLKDTFHTLAKRLLRFGPLWTFWFTLNLCTCGKVNI
jgi:hypothetical protein